MSQTPLSRLLAEQPPTRPDALTAFRATLFRWGGGKEQMLVETIWSIALPSFEQATVGASHTRGPQRIVETFVYAIAGVTPDPAKVRQAIRAL